MLTLLIVFNITIILGKRAQKIIGLHKRTLAFCTQDSHKKDATHTFAPKIDECYLIELPYYNLSSYSYLSFMYKQYDSQNALAVRLYLSRYLYLYLYMYMHLYITYIYRVYRTHRRALFICRIVPAATLSSKFPLVNSGGSHRFARSFSAIIILGIPSDGFSLLCSNGESRKDNESPRNNRFIRCISIDSLYNPYLSEIYSFH